MSDRERAYGPTIWQNEYAREVAATAKRYKRERNPEIRMAHAETLRRLTDDLTTTARSLASMTPRAATPCSRASAESV